MSKFEELEGDASKNKINVPKASDLKENKRSILGSIVYPFSHLIGKGDEAKDSVVWYLITRLVRISLWLTLILFAVDIWYEKGKNCLEILKQVWSVFAPVITLALGYLFGKRERQNNE